MDVASEVGSVARSLADEINKASGWFIALGVFLIVAGVVMLLYPLYSGMVLTTVVGFFFVLGGILYLLNSFAARNAGGFIFRILIGAVYIAAGVWMLTQPLEGLTALTVLLGVALALGGIFKLLLAGALTGVPGVGMIIFSGLASIVLAVLIFLKLPAASEVSIGILVGIDFISSGASLTAVAVRAKALTRAVGTAS